MNSIYNNPLRVGNFTSSGIISLMSMGKRKLTPEELAARPKKGDGSSVTQTDDPNTLGAAALTYIQECNWERDMGRPLENETTARPLSWGKLVEKRVNDLMPLGSGYRYCSDKTIVHPDYDYWSGSPDFEKYVNEMLDAIADAKSPATLKSFCTLIEPSFHGKVGLDWMNALRFGFTDKDKKNHDKHKEAETYYWQLVSNTILAGVDYAELIIYCPYKSELEAIKELATPSLAEDLGSQRNNYWIYQAQDNELPWIPDGGKYKNLNIIRFQVPESDKKLLEQRVVLGGKKLVPRLKVA